MVIKLLKQYSGTIFFLLVEAGLEMSPIQNLAISITLWSIAGIWAIIATVRWIKNPRQFVQNKYNGLYAIIPLLRKMDRYLWSIADSFTIANVNFEKFQQLGAKSRQLLHIRNITLDPKQSLEVWIEDANRIVKRDSKIIKEQIEKSDLGGINKTIVATTRLIDDEGYGLRDIKVNDKKYNRFKQKIEKYHDYNCDLVDGWLSYLIYFHVHMSEYFANGLLLIKRANWISQKTGAATISEIGGPEVQANLGDLENDSNERLSEIRTAIEVSIQEMERETKDSET